MRLSKKSILDDVVIAAPCPMDWSEMKGDDRIRFCSGCNQNVYNVSSMSRREAEVFLEANLEKVCLRFFRRGDGTLITSDCPLREKIVRTIKRQSKAVVLAFLALLNVDAVLSKVEESKAETTGDISVKVQPVVIDERGFAIGRGPRIQKKSPTLPEGAPLQDAVNSEQQTQSHKEQEASLADRTAMNAFMDAQRCEEKGDLAGASTFYEQALHTIRKSKVRFDNQFIVRVAYAYAANLRKVGLDAQAKEIEKEFALDQSGTLLDTEKTPLIQEGLTNEDIKIQLTRDMIRGIKREGFDVLRCPASPPPKRQKNPGIPDKGQLEGI